MNFSTCRACGAPIGFIKTRNGKTMPVNAESLWFVPDQNGSKLYVLPDGTVTRGAEPMEGDKDQHIGYLSHFATCPEADRFRRPRKSERKAGHD